MAAAVSASRRRIGSLELALTKEAQALARVLRKTRAQLVLAESCTGGMVAAALTRVPGISKHLCGSSVVYQSETKQQWLKIRRDLVKREGTESLAMSQALASAVLKATSQATVSAAITGEAFGSARGAAACCHTTAFAISSSISKETAARCPASSRNARLSVSAAGVLRTSFRTAEATACKSATSLLSRGVSI